MKTVMLHQRYLFIWQPFLMISSPLFTSVFRWIFQRDCYKEKCERLNIQLNYILGADDKRLVDIDALVLDNK